MKLLLLSLLVLLSVAVGCPPNIQPCTCQRPYAEKAYITCSSLYNYDDLATVAEATKNKNYIKSFLIQNSVFYFIPSDVFAGNRFDTLEIKNTTLMALTDTRVAFIGLEEHLSDLILTHCELLTRLDWSVFRNLKKLKRVEMVASSLDSLDGLETIEGFEHVNLEGNWISDIPARAFGNLERLRFLSLSNNSISEMARSMLPNPATELAELNLSNNEIEQLPDDMFTNMPNLNLLSISNNRILLLNARTFGPVWETLQFFDAMGNDLRCDCRMSWILEKRSAPQSRAVCGHPVSLKGKSITSLSGQDLWCYKK